jgi:hypothetical protein
MGIRAAIVTVALGALAAFACAEPARPAVAPIASAAPTASSPSTRSGIFQNVPWKFIEADNRLILGDGPDAVTIVVEKLPQGGWTTLHPR